MNILVWIRAEEWYADVDTASELTAPMELATRAVAPVTQSSVQTEPVVATTGISSAAVNGVNVATCRVFAAQEMLSVPGVVAILATALSLIRERNRYPTSCVATPQMVHVEQRVASLAL